MEVDEIQRSQVCKFQRISSNDNSSNPNKIGTQKANHQYLHEDGVSGGGGGGGGVGRLCGWPSSRIVRVSRASGGKDRHSKVLTSKGLRDRRVRLSVTTAIQFYDLQDRLGYDQPSKAVEWLIKAASSSISELPSLDPSFNDCNDVVSLNNNNNISVSKSSACSSTSETSKGNDVVSRSENRVKARERAREMAAKKEKEKENDVVSLNRVNNCISQNSSFTDLLTGGSATVSPNNNSPESRIHWTTTTPMDYFFNRPPQFNMTAGENYNFAPAGESYNLNFSIASSSSSGGGGGFASGFNRGTLQSNLLSVSPHHHHHNLQRFQSSSMVDGSTSTNFPFFIAPNIGSTAPEHFPATAGYGGADRKEKSKN